MLKTKSKLSPSKATSKAQMKNFALLLELEKYLKEMYAEKSPVVKEFQFHPRRKWRFDYALPETLIKIAIEIEGGIFSGGRHTRGAGYQKDMHKYNTATKMGWKVYRFSYNDLQKQTYKDFF